MPEGPYLMCIDFGTESARVGIFDRECTPGVLASETYDLVHPRPGWAEHEAYRFHADRYIDTYPQMKELMHKTVQHAASGSKPTVGAEA